MSASPERHRLGVPLSQVVSGSQGPLPPQLRSALNGALLASNSIPAIQAALLHECQASGFVAALRRRVLELLRGGECATYAEVMERVMGEIRGEETPPVMNGDKEKKERLKVPTRVVEEGVRVVRQALEGVVEIGDD